MSQEWDIPDGGNIVLALTDDDLGVEGQVEVDHRDEDFDDGGNPESDSPGTVAAIHNERRVSIKGRVEAERMAALALADAVKKSKKDRRDVYNSLFEESTTSTGKLSDQRIDPEREGNLKTSQSPEPSSSVPAVATSSKGLAATVFPIRARPCHTDAVTKSQWCKSDAKQKDATGADQTPLPERNYCCSSEFTQVHSQDFAKSGKEKHNEAVTSKRRELGLRIRCPKEKPAKPPLPMTIMRLL